MTYSLKVFSPPIKYSFANIPASYQKNTLYNNFYCTSSKFYNAYFVQKPQTNSRINRIERWSKIAQKQTRCKIICRSENIIVLALKYCILWMGKASYSSTSPSFSMRKWIKKILLHLFLFIQKSSWNWGYLFLKFWIWIVFEQCKPNQTKQRQP